MTRKYSANFFITVFLFLSLYLCTNVYSAVTDSDNDGLPDSQETSPVAILDFQTNSYTTNTQTNICVASDGTNYFAVWQSLGQNGMAYEIYGQMFDNEGNPIGVEKKIGDTSSTTYATNTNPSIYFNGSAYMVAWQSVDISGGSENGYYQIQAGLFDTSGNSIKIINVTSPDPLEQSFPVITGNNDYFLVAWRSNREGETGSSVCYPSDKVGQMGQYY